MGFGLIMIEERYDILRNGKIYAVVSIECPDKDFNKLFQNYIKKLADKVEMKVDQH